MSDELDIYDPVLFGDDRSERLVAVSFNEGAEADKITLFSRENDKTVCTEASFRPFILVEQGYIKDCPHAHDVKKLKGNGRLKECVSFANWKDVVSAKTWLSRETGFSPSAPGAPYLFVNDPVQQYLTVSGKTLFKGMEFESLRRLQVDIECTTAEGYEFCNADRKEDSIIAIALADQSGWVEVLSGTDMDEKQLLTRFVEIVAERDPDVIEGHNIFNFDLPYIAKRAKMHKVKLAIGRDKSVPKVRPSRFSAGERTISYKRYDVFGRHIVDTLFMLQVYDISHRSLNGFGLKDAAIHFGLAAKGRTYIDGADIANEFRKNPEKVIKYAGDDVTETRALSALLSRSYFIQASMLPYTYQNVAVRGNATKINMLMVREYLRKGKALPKPGESREFAGGYTDLFETGVIENVHHCDVRSLYPSLMLTHGLGPSSDELGVFLKMLESLRDFRLKAKRKMIDSGTDAERNYYDALQTAFKVLINSFYGYLGFAQGNFNDFGSAEQVTAQGRDLLSGMIEWLEKRGARPIEIDTDGVY
jgi:DNA polymerase I